MSGTQTPWVAGDYVFVIANGKTMTAVSRRNGAVRWTATLPGKMWAGPVLAGGRLLAVSSDGNLASVSAQTGQIFSTSKQGDAYLHRAGRCQRHGLSPRRRRYAFGLALTGPP